MKLWMKLLIGVAVLHTIPCFLQVYSSAFCPKKYVIFNTTTDSCGGVVPTLGTLVFWIIVGIMWAVVMSFWDEE